jgi:two-component system LytT family sensor kinase
MKKQVLTLLILIFALSYVPAVIAQKLPPGSFGHSISFNLAISDSLRSLGYINSSFGINDTGLGAVSYKPTSSQDQTMKTPIMLGVKLNPALMDYTLSPVRSFSKTYTAYRISDRSGALLIALGITKNNVNDYRYRVVLNDSVEVVHWSKIPGLEQKYGAEKPYGFIGNFNYPDKQILVEVVNVKNYQLRDGVIFDWRKNFKPIVTNIRFQPPMPTGKKKKMIGLDQMNIQAPHNIKYDTLTGAPTDIRFFADSVNNITMFFKDHETVAYDVILYRTENGKKEYFSGAEGNHLGTEFKFNFMNYPTGDYEIIVRPQGSGGFNMQDQQLHIPLKILPNPVLEKKASLKELLPYVVAALLIFGLLFWGYRRRANINLAKSIQARQTVNLKLRSIRSQLNPHFMFNALTSIQNLVNKNDMEGANHYLSRFADLTRKVLHTGERDLISLDDEIRILDDYLQMEQLRFNFKYDIKVGDNLNCANTEVPAMLLQPFLENSVKHGVANLREKGIVNVLINKNSNNLVFTITDNGPGFKQKPGETVNGSFGLKLSEERIELLNQVYKDQPATLNIETAGTGTIVTITLTNWIS